MVTKKSPLTISLIIFYLGVLLGLSLTAIASWADLEAASYGFDETGSQQLGSLSCPIMMTKNETSSFSVKVTNPTKGKLSPGVRTKVTSPFGPITSYSPPTALNPGESKQFEWTIGPGNLELRQFIFAYAWVYGTYPIPNRENTCGILVVNLPTNGKVITSAMTILSLLGIGTGLFGIRKFRNSVKNRVVDMLRFNLLSIFAIAGLITAFMGWWIQGIIVIVVSLLLLVVSVLTGGR